MTQGNKFSFTRILLGLGLVCLVGIACADTTQTSKSNNGLFSVTVESRLEPLRLRQIHAWVATITSPDGVAVSDASIEVSGGMPIHNHGFPTAPRVTKNLGDGKYLIQGVKFSMPGPWVIRLDITAGEQEDHAVFDIILP